MAGFAIRSACVVHRRTPIASPVKTAFGVMRERHGVFLVLRDEDGREGTGESWVNFPAWAAWERVAAFEHAFVPRLDGADVEDIPSFIRETYRIFAPPAVQSGTVGPLLQALCAVELALWDLDAQRTGLPLARLLFDRPAARVRVYASGLNTPLPWDRIDEHLDMGVDLYKLKLGFGDDADRRAVEALLRHLDGRARIAVDVNRAWTPEQAFEWLPALAEWDVAWLEEPLAPEAEGGLGALREAGRVPLAGGENVLMAPGGSVDGPARMPFDFLQPDLTKYAPLHMARELLRAAERDGKRVVPHFLGSGPGLAASLQFAAGCPEALVELDINPNPLRTDLMEEPFVIEDGCIAIPDRSGIGWRLKA